MKSTPHKLEDDLNQSSLQLRDDGNRKHSNQFLILHKASDFSEGSAHGSYDSNRDHKVPSKLEPDPEDANHVDSDSYRNRVHVQSIQRVALPDPLLYVPGADDGGVEHNGLEGQRHHERDWADRELSNPRAQDQRHDRAVEGRKERAGLIA